VRTFATEMLNCLHFRPHRSTAYVDAAYYYTVARCVCWSVAPTILAAFFSCALELWPMTSTFEGDLDSAKGNKHAKHLDQMSSSSEVIVRTERHKNKHTRPIALLGPLQW